MNQNKQWGIVLQKSLAAKASDIALDVAKRCCSDANIQQILAADANSGDDPIRWRSSSLAGGDTGIAFLSTYIRDCFPKQDWETTTHEYLTRAVNDYNPKTTDISLYSGASGLGLTAVLASQHGKHYTGLRQELDNYLSASIPLFIAQMSRLPDLHIQAFDLISGATGIAAYVLTSDTETVEFIKARKDLLAFIVSLTKSDPKTGLYYHVLPKQMYGDERQKRYPLGYSDTGLAHGVSGVIGILALALDTGLVVPGMQESLDSLARWLISQHIEDEYGMNWPTFIDPAGAGRNVAVGSRAAWCYGIPGIARALHLAGRALHDEDLQQTALAAFDSLIVRPREQWGISSPNFCHGLSGILQSTLRMYHDTHYAKLRPFVTQLTTEILSLYNPDNLFGFQDKNLKNNWYDSPRLLDGASGVALALLAASQPVKPNWDRLFLLS